MAAAGLGTDTGGSCRIPAAFCGIVGYKPTARRVPIAGVLPLSPSLDSDRTARPLGRLLRSDRRDPGRRAANPTGPGCRSPACASRCRRRCWTAWTPTSPPPSPARSRCCRWRVPASATPPSPPSKRSTTANASGGFAAAEAYAWHRRLLAEKAAGYDPRIRLRIERGARVSAADYLDLLAARARIIAGFEAATRDFDALVLPTSPIVPPRIAELDDEADYNRLNLLILRNTVPANFLDRCAISLPCHRAGRAAGGPDADGRDDGRCAAVRHRSRGGGGARLKPPC